jgi:hypothetical protein
MGNVVYEGDDFKRMLRADMVKLKRLVESGAVGIHEIAYKDKKIKVEIVKKGNNTIVKRWRTM